MYPTSYKTTGNIVEFFYDQKEWDEWKARGKSTGDVGGVLKFIKDKSLVTYFTFGTLEHPYTNMYQLSYVYNPLFDEGPLQEPDYYLKPLAEERDRKYWEEFTKNMKVVWLDVNNGNTIISELHKPKFEPIKFNKDEPTRRPL